MSKSIYEKAVEILNKFRNQNYNSTNKDEVELANAINVILTNYVEQEKLLKLYRYLNENTNDYDLPFGFVNDIHNAIDKIEKQIKELDMVDNGKESTDIFKPRFEVGEVVIYQNGDRFELGIIKTVERHSETSYKYRVWYHTGETTAMTDEYLLKKISNLYAFKIKRYDTEGKVIDE